jgi:hypothetical protein
MEALRLHAPHMSTEDASLARADSATIRRRHVASGVPQGRVGRALPDKPRPAMAAATGLPALRSAMISISSEHSIASTRAAMAFGWG